MFTNKVVLVTGSSVGIGAGTAIKFAEEGAAAVVIHGRQEAALKSVKEKVEKAGNGQTKVHVVVGDVTEDAVRKRLIEETVQKFGQLDVLVNNVGLINAPQSPIDEPIEDFDKIFNVNLRSMIVLTQLAIPHLIKTKGNIVNVSSIGAVRATPPNYTYYRMSKAAMDHYTRCLAVELGPKGVRVNSVNPGYIPETELATKRGATADEIKQRIAQVAQVTPVRRVGTVREVAEHIIFVASDKASFITGTIGLIDGGIGLQ